MFTGLVATTGEIVSRHVSGGAGALVIHPDKSEPMSQLEYGESIAINGTCLTLEREESSGNLVFHVLNETLRRTNLGAMPIGAKVNLERALAFGTRLGGHLVQGHVDATSSIIAIRNVGDDHEVEVELPESLAPYLIEKGSIAIDGISLTLVRVDPTAFAVHIIPVTWAETALRYRKAGDLVNLEGDLIGKYVVRQLALSQQGAGSQVNMNMLRDAGWE